MRWREPVCGSVRFWLIGCAEVLPRTVFFQSTTFSLCCRSGQAVSFQGSREIRKSPKRIAPVGRTTKLTGIAHRYDTGDENHTENQAAGTQDLNNVLVGFEKLQML